MAQMCWQNAAGCKYPVAAVNLVTNSGPGFNCRRAGRGRVGALQDFPACFPVDSGAMPMVVCAAKPYLAQYGVPEKKPADLGSHSRLEYSVRPDSGLNLYRAGRFLHRPDSTGAVRH